MTIGLPHTPLALPLAMHGPTWSGLYYGEIRDAEDPEKRRRYRVRVHTLHGADVPDNVLPWADHVIVGGKFWGDWPGFAVGDRVIVGFFSGNPHFPIILGAWVNASAELLDTPPDLAVRYAEGRRRWLRVDRVGNYMELNEIDHVAKLGSQAAAILVWGDAQTIELVSAAHVRKGRTIQDRVVGYALNAEDVLIEAEAFNALGGASGMVTVLSNLDIYLKAYADFVIGLHVHTFMGELASPPTVEQGDRAIIGTKYIYIGTTDTTKIGPFPGVLTPATTEISIVARGVGSFLKLQTPDGVMQLSSGQTLTIDVTGEVSISSDVKVTVGAPAVTIQSSDIQMTI